MYPDRNLLTEEDWERYCSIVRLFLSHGADPNAFIPSGGYEASKERYSRYFGQLKSPSTAFGLYLSAWLFTRPNAHSLHTLNDFLDAGANINDHCQGGRHCSVFSFFCEESRCRSFISSIDERKKWRQNLEPFFRMILSRRVLNKETLESLRVFVRTWIREKIPTETVDSLVLEIERQLAELETASNRKRKQSMTANDEFQSAKRAKVGEHGEHGASGLEVVGDDKDILMGSSDGVENCSDSDEPMEV
jgi:hypothetical protein